MQKSINLKKNYLRGDSRWIFGRREEKDRNDSSTIPCQKVCAFDEIDTGLDIDALKKVAREINSLKKEELGAWL